MTKAPNSPRHLRVLVIDETPETARMAKLYLSPIGHQVVAVSTAASALTEARQTPFDVILLDIQPRNESGLELISALRASNPRAPLLVMGTPASHGSLETVIEAMKRGASDFLCKPITPDQIRLLVHNVAEGLSGAQAAASQQQGIVRPSAIIDYATESAAAREATDIARRAAAGTAAILIQGERGVGKRTLCRAIHDWGSRAEQPFSVAGCRAPSQRHLESEWFGALRTGNDGAVVERSGRVSAADGGTLLIEDIDLLPAPMQIRLLRLIERGEYERIGDFKTRKVDVRVLATTLVDLRQRVRDGTFDSDLFHAMGGAAVFLPPLRHRPHDTVMLAERYLAFFARQTRRNVVSFSHGAKDALQRHSWPGNIRELRSLIERTVLLAHNEQIETSDFPQGTLNRVNAAALGDPVPLQRIEELHIRGVLAAATSMEAAAATLGIDTVTLWRRRKRYGI